MNLSIFNFNKSIKIITIFFGLFIVYTFYLIVQKPNIIMFQNTNQSNISKVQDYIYNKSSDIIIVGSSMSNTMHKEFFRNKIYNLSFSGGTSLTGIELIRRSEKIPKIMIIESNIIFERDVDHKFIDAVYTPVLWKLRSLVPSLQEKYQLLNLIISKIKGSVGKSHDQRMLDTRNDFVFKNQMKLRVKDINSKLQEFSNKLIRLRKNIEYFERLGVKIYFIELPVADAIKNSSKYKQTRAIIKENFTFLNLEHDTHSYQTSDGIHLIYSSAYHISQKILKSLESTK